MPFIGTQPDVGGYSVLDALTASATASYTLQKGSANFSPSSANQLLVSLNGVIQKPGSSFTVSGSTLTFSSALASSDSIDFVLAMGEPLLVGTPSDGAVNTTQLATNAVSTAKIANNAVTVGKLATSGTLPALNGSALTSVIPEGPAFYAELSSNQNLSSNVTTTLSLAAEGYDTDGCYNNTGSTVTLNGISTPAYSFAPNVAGYYSIHIQARPQVLTSKQAAYVFSIRKNGSTSISTAQFDVNQGSSTDAAYFTHTVLVAMNGTSDYVDFRGYQYNYTSPQTLFVSASSGQTYAYGHLALKL